MKTIVRGVCLALVLAVGVVSLSGSPTQIGTAQAADSVVGVPIDLPFRCFLCDWYGCTISNVGGSGCDDSRDSCEVVQWGCSEWPAGLVRIRW